MKTIKLYLALFAMVWGVGSVQSQDIHFSQFYMSPLNLNPAMTGVNNCKNRFVANYRNQWASVLQSNSFNTYSVSYDQKTPVGREDYFGVGGTIWGDVAGASRFGSTQGRISASYAKKMAGYRKKASYLVIGADAGLTQRRISQEDLLWPGQINGGVGGEIQDSDFLYGDISAGLLWFSVIDKYTNWYLGAAIHHLNRPNISFQNTDARLYSRYTIHGGGQFQMKPKISLLPFAVFMAQGPHRELNFGSSVRFALGPSRLSNQSWQVGAWYRLGVQEDDQFDSEGNPINQTAIHSDAVIVSTRFNYENFGIGFSYDLNVSELSGGGTANGAFEFSLTYDICGPENRGVYCPRF